MENYLLMRLVMTFVVILTFVLLIALYHISSRIVGKFKIKIKESKW